VKKIHQLNKLLLITYNLAGLCLLIIAGMVGIGASPGYIPMWLIVATIFVFLVMIFFHIYRYFLKKKL